MIRINLATRRQASYIGQNTQTSTRASSVASKFGSLKIFDQESTGSLLGRIVIPVVLAVGVNYGADYYMTYTGERMKAEQTTLEGERTKIESELKRIKGFDSVKLELESNELILKTKITTIENLIKGRDTALKVLVTLTQSIPKDVWLSEIIVTDTNYDIKGSTPDIGLVSDVMSKLGKSIYFKEVALKNSTADSAGKIATFELTARKE